MPYRIFHQHLDQDDHISPQHGYEHRISCGSLHHITGSNTILYIYEGEKIILTYLAALSGGLATQDMSLNDKITTNWVILVDTTKIWISDKQSFYLEGDNNAYAELLIEERWEGIVPYIKPDIQAPTEKPWWWPF